MKGAVGKDESMLPVEEVHARQFDDELIVLDLQRGEYYALNATGARMWAGLVTGATPAQVARSMASEYEVPYEQAVDDCLILANELVTRGLLRRQSPWR